MDEMVMTLCTDGTPMLTLALLCSVVTREAVMTAPVLLNGRNAFRNGKTGKGAAGAQRMFGTGTENTRHVAGILRMMALNRLPGSRIKAR